VRQDSLPVAVMPVAELEIQGQQALGPRGPVCGGHLQALGASCRAPHEGEEQRVGTPGEKGARRLGPENLGWEEDAPALGLLKAARVARPHHLAGCNDVHVARLHPPLPVAQPHRAATPLEVGEHEEVVGVGVCVR
jgi:hypothetical protein